MVVVLFATDPGVVDRQAFRGRDRCCRRAIKGKMKQGRTITAKMRLPRVV
jgi:hypothetical protein